MKKFIKACEDLISTAEYELTNGDINRLCYHILYTFKKFNANDNIDKRLKSLEDKLDLCDAENVYSFLHSAYWHLKNKEFIIENMSDFAKIIDDKNEELYKMKNKKQEE